MTRASSFAPASWRGTHSRATHQRARQHRSSVRFDWRWCWPYAVGGCALVCIGSGLNAVASFDVSEPIGEIFWSSASTLAAIGGALIGISAWWPDLEAEKQAADAQARAELEARQRWWSEAADEMLELKRQYAEAQKNHQPSEHIWRRMRDLNAQMLVGGEVR